MLYSFWLKIKVLKINYSFIDTVWNENEASTEDGNMVYYVIYQVYVLPCTLTDALLIFPSFLRTRFW